MEIDEVFLPELLSVDWSPSERFLVYFLSKFVDGREDFIVLVKILELFL